MFAARIILEGVISLSSSFDSVKRFALPLLAVFLFLVGILLPKLGNLSYPWCINIAFTVAGFMLLGYSMKPLIEKVAKNPVCTVLIFVLSATVFMAGSVLRAERLEMVLLRSGDYGDIVWFFVNSLSGCLLILSISSLISRNWNFSNSYAAFATGGFTAPWTHSFCYTENADFSGGHGCDKVYFGISY